MTELLYLRDSYLRDFNARIMELNPNGVVLDRTAFYVEGGGQPGDEGKILAGSREYAVKNVLKKNGKIVHVIKDMSGLETGMEVKGIVNWEKRYRLMRMHTAAHILSGLIFQKHGSMVTGNQLGLDKSRIDFDLERLEDDDIKWLEGETNKIVDEGREVSIEFLPVEEAYEIPQIFKLKHILPKSLREIRVVKINGVDASACGGAHVRNTKEIGMIKILKKESKGRGHRRIYFTVMEE